MGILHSALVQRWLVSGIALVVVKLAVGKALALREAFAKIRDYPGRSPLWIHALNVVAIALGTKFPRPGMAGYYAAKFSSYERYGATSFATVRVWAAQPFFWLADPEAVKQIVSDRSTFPKDVAEYEILNIYGKNVVSVEGSDWKRHRSVAMSAFNETNVALVWSEALRVTNEWLQELDSAHQENSLNVMEPLTQLTLLIIAAAGFGRRVSWSAESTAEPPPGCKLTFRSAVIGSVENVIFRALLPTWFYLLAPIINVPHLSSRALKTQLAFDDLRIHMLDLVSSAHVEITSGKSMGGSGAALLRNLVEANMNQESDAKKLTEGEMLSNIFAFLLAGHETSAHSLCFAFVLLALYPDCQRKMYDEIAHVWPADAPLTQLMTNHREHMDKLEYTIACIRETLRLFPSEPRIGKQVAKDTVLPGTYFTPGFKDRPSVETGKFSMAISAGSFVVMDVWGLHMNTLSWGPDVAEFKPERFMDTPTYQWPRNAFLPFSGGARSCIGQRFALAEMVGILASVVRRYTIHVPDDLAGEPLEVQKEALLKWHTGVTLTPSNPRVKLSRRV